MSSVILALFFLVVVLAMVWVGAGMILRRWEGSRWHRRWRARIREEWERAERLVRSPGEEEGEEAMGEEGRGEEDQEEQDRNP